MFTQTCLTKKGKKTETKKRVLVWNPDKRYKFSEGDFTNWR